MISQTPRKLLSALTLLFFLSSELARAHAMIPEPQNPERLPALSIALPESLGTVRQITAARPGSPFLFHIHTAHGSPEVSHGVAAILDFLQKQYGISLVFTEGASVPLRGDFFRFSPDAAGSRRLKDALTETGELSGPDLVLKDSRFQVLGVEHPLFYRLAFKAFKNVMSQNRDAQKFLEDLRLEMDRQSSTLNPELRRLIRVWLDFQNEAHDLGGLLRVLDHESRDLFGIDFRNPLLQEDWPQMTRLAFYRELEKDRDDAVLSNEFARLEAWLSAQKLDKAILVRLHKPSGGNDRSFYESFLSQTHARGFRFRDYPQILRRAAMQVLEEELSAPELFTEIERLFENLFRQRMTGPGDLETLERYRRWVRLKRLVSLELNRDEWNPWHPDEGLPERGGRRLAGVIRSAAEFYRLAEIREVYFRSRILAEMAARKQVSAVLVTGGFHGDGMRRLLSGKAGLASLEPRITAETGRRFYVQAMMGLSHLEKPDFAQPAGLGDKSYHRAELDRIREAARHSGTTLSGQSAWERDRMRYLGVPLTVKNGKSELRSDGDLRQRVRGLLDVLEPSLTVLEEIFRRIDGANPSDESRRMLEAEVDLLIAATRRFHEVYRVGERTDEGGRISDVMNNKLGIVSMRLQLAKESGEHPRLTAGLGVLIEQMRRLLLISGLPGDLNDNLRLHHGVSSSFLPPDGVAAMSIEQDGHSELRSATSGTEAFFQDVNQTLRRLDVHLNHEHRVQFRYGNPETFSAAEHLEDESDITGIFRERGFVVGYYGLDESAGTREARKPVFRHEYILDPERQGLRYEDLLDLISRNILVQEGIFPLALFGEWKSLMARWSVSPRAELRTADAHRYYLNVDEMIRKIYRERDPALVSLYAAAEQPGGVAFSSMAATLLHFFNMQDNTAAVDDPEGAVRETYGQMKQFYAAANRGEALPGSYEQYEKIIAYSRSPEGLAFSRLSGRIHAYLQLKGGALLEKRVMPGLKPENAEAAARPVLYLAHNPLPYLGSLVSSGRKTVTVDIDNGFTSGFLNGIRENLFLQHVYEHHIGNLFDFDVASVAPGTIYLENFGNYMRFEDVPEVLSPGLPQGSERNRNDGDFYKAWHDAWRGVWRQTVRRWLTESGPGVEFILRYAIENPQSARNHEPLVEAFDEVLRAGGYEHKIGYYDDKGVFHENAAGGLVGKDGAQVRPMTAHVFRIPVRSEHRAVTFDVLIDREKFLRYGAKFKDPEAALEEERRTVTADLKNDSVMLHKVYEKLGVKAEEVHRVQVEWIPTEGVSKELYQVRIFTRDKDPQPSGVAALHTTLTYLKKIRNTSFSTLHEINKAERFKTAGHQGKFPEIYAHNWGPLHHTPLIFSEWVEGRTLTDLMRDEVVRTQGTLRKDQEGLGGAGGKNILFSEAGPGLGPRGQDAADNQRIAEALRPWAEQLRPRILELLGIVLDSLAATGTTYEFEPDDVMIENNTGRLRLVDPGSRDVRGAFNQPGQILEAFLEDYTAYESSSRDKGVWEYLKASLLTPREVFDFILQRDSSGAAGRKFLEKASGYLAGRAATSRAQDVMRDLNKVLSAARAELRTGPGTVEALTERERQALFLGFAKDGLEDFPGVLPAEFVEAFEDTKFLTREDLGKPLHEMSTGQRIEAIRSYRHWSWKQDGRKDAEGVKHGNALAKAAGFSSSNYVAVKRMRAGKWPEPQNLWNLARVLKVDPALILFGEPLGPAVFEGMPFNEVMRALRYRLGLTQEQFALRLQKEGESRIPAVQVFDTDDDDHKRSAVTQWELAGKGRRAVVPEPFKRPIIAAVLGYDGVFDNIPELPSSKKKAPQTQQKAVAYPIQPPAPAVKAVFTLPAPPSLPEKSPGEIEFDIFQRFLEEGESLAARGDAEFFETLQKLMHYLEELSDKKRWRGVGRHFSLVESLILNMTDTYVAQTGHHKLSAEDEATVTSLLENARMLFDQPDAAWRTHPVNIWLERRRNEIYQKVLDAKILRNRAMDRGMQDSEYTPLLDRAEALLQEARRINREEPYVLHGLAEVALRRRDAPGYDAAERYLKQILKNTPDYVPALNSLGRMAFAQGDNLGALSRYGAVLDIRPNDAVALNSLGQISLWLDKAWEDRLQEAAYYFERVLELYPGNVYGLVGHAKVLYLQELPYLVDTNTNLTLQDLDNDRWRTLRQAHEELQQAIRTRRDQDRTYVSLGIFYIAIGDYRDARAAFETAFKLNKDSSRAERYMGMRNEQYDRERANLRDLEIRHGSEFLPRAREAAGDLPETEAVPGEGVWKGEVLHGASGTEKVIKGNAVFLRPGIVSRLNHRMVSPKALILDYPAYREAVSGKRVTQSVREYATHYAETYLQKKEIETVVFQNAPYDFRVPAGAHFARRAVVALRGSLDEIPHDYFELTLKIRGGRYEASGRPVSAWGERPELRSAVRQGDESLLEAYKTRLAALGLEFADDTGRIRFRSDFKPLELKFNLVVIPHGQTDANITGILHGRADGKPENFLNADGIAQATAGGEELAALIRAQGWNLDDIVFLRSPLERTHQTWQHQQPALAGLDAARNFEPRVEESAAEISFGSWDGKTLDQVLAQLGPIEARWVEQYRNLNALARSPTGENFLMFLERVRAFVESLNQRYAGKTVILYGHGTQSAALKVIFGSPDLKNKSYIDWRDHQVVLPRGRPTLFPAAVRGELRAVPYTKRIAELSRQIAEPPYDETLSSGVRLRIYRLSRILQEHSGEESDPLDAIAIYTAFGSDEGAIMVRRTKKGMEAIVPRDSDRAENTLQRLLDRLGKAGAERAGKKFRLHPTLANVLVLGLIHPNVKIRYAAVRAILGLPRDQRREMGGILRRMAVDSQTAPLIVMGVLQMLEADGDVEALLDFVRDRTRARTLLQRALQGLREHAATPEVAQEIAQIIFDVNTDESQMISAMDAIAVSGNFQTAPLLLFSLMGHSSARVARAAEDALQRVWIRVDAEFNIPSRLRNPRGELREAALIPVTGLDLVQGTIVIEEPRLWSGSNAVRFALAVSLMGGLAGKDWPEAVRVQYREFFMTLLKTADGGRLAERAAWRRISPAALVPALGSTGQRGLRLVRLFDQLPEQDDPGLQVLADVAARYPGVQLLLEVRHADRDQIRALESQLQKDIRARRLALGQSFKGVPVRVTGFLPQNRFEGGAAQDRILIFGSDRNRLESLRAEALRQQVSRVLAVEDDVHGQSSALKEASALLAALDELSSGKPSPPGVVRAGDLLQQHLELVHRLTRLLEQAA